jgi:hypothetical protein
VVHSAIQQAAANNATWKKNRLFKDELISSTKIAVCWIGKFSHKVNKCQYDIDSFKNLCFVKYFEILFFCIILRISKRRSEHFFPKFDFKNLVEPQIKMKIIFA